ncbi:sensor domain-containing diguanylate cyclase [Castellaniella sp.]|uniref:sensor domain-containing diguanylate cyclase n=1 Tax=Castellaniella sp. TaxID=1955812 RepID=UPI0025B9A804|nr:sensor domain-containing diguanylate cyclase [Castellaniella sp.]
MFAARLRSLRVKLVLPYVLLVALVSVVLGATYYWSASQTIGSFSDQYIREVAARIAQAVHFHVRGSAAVLEAAFPDGMPATADISSELTALRQRFWVATSVYSNPNDYVYYGNRAGQSLALKRLSDDEAELRLKLRPTEHRAYYRYTGIAGMPHYLRRESGLFDPRTRIWFETGKHTEGHFWTSVYIDFTTHDLVVTRARRVLAADGTFEGVVATDVPLKEINHFIATLKVGEHGRAIVVERDGNLLAGTGLQNLEKSSGGRVTRINALETGDPVIRAAYASVAPLLHQAKPVGDASREQAYWTTAVDQDGQTIAVAAQRVIDDAGLDWTAIVAMPRDEIFLGIERQLWIALGVGLLAVALTILFGMRLFGRIAQDIISLSHAVTRIRQGATDAVIDVRRRDEVGDLARNFKAMRTELFTDRLTGVASRTALESLLGAATRTRAGSPFTLFFLDLNDFKPLNDRYGHDNGDRALIEIAHRLQACLRPSDLVARLGGDEFVVFVSGATAPAAIATLTAKLTDAVQAPLHTLHDVPTGTEVRLGVAIGHAIWPDHGVTPGELMQRADADMYQHKSSRFRSP